MIEFSPVSATIGGVLIGASTVLLLWLNGRVAGVSGILYGIFNRERSDRDWRILFVAGLILGGLLYQGITDQPLSTRSDFPPLTLIVAGLLVGAGTRLGSGCTSGHAVCGISRLSLRSVIATLTFVSAAMMTATFMRFLFGTAS